MEDPHPSLGRRAVLGGIAVAVAGCSQGEPTDRGSTDTTTPVGTDPMETTGGDPTSEPTTQSTQSGSPALDLAEANVVGVETTPVDGGVRFDVTLHHDDDGESGYADWWQVDSRAGERLGRRVLAHPHGTRPFTRSATVQVPAGLDCVVVRGHDQTHGYGGRAMLVAPATGATTVLDQGADPVSPVEAPCP